MPGAREVLPYRFYETNTLESDFSKHTALSN